MSSHQSDDVWCTKCLYNQSSRSSWSLEGTWKAKVAFSAAKQDGNASALTKLMLPQWGWLWCTLLSQFTTIIWSCSVLSVESGQNAKLDQTWVGISNFEHYHSFNSTITYDILWSLKRKGSKGQHEVIGKHGSPGGHRVTQQSHRNMSCAHLH